MKMLQNHLLPRRKTGIFYPLSKSRLHAGIETVVGGILLRRQIPGFMASKTYAQHGLTEKIVGYVFSGERIPIRGAAGNQRELNCGGGDGSKNTYKLSNVMRFPQFRERCRNRIM